MELKYQKWNRLKELFYEESNKSFTVRELAKQTKQPVSSVQRYLQQLKKEGFISEDNQAIITSYFKIKKTHHFIEKLFEIGLLEFLEQKLQPSVIILFGSMRKGEYTAESDIDIFIEQPTLDKKNKGLLNLKPFEKKLNHKIELHIEKSINDLPAPLYNNIINGIKLYGYVKVK